MALGFGFTVASLAWVLGHTSGAHFNPSLTIAMFLTRKVSLARSVFYIIFQTVGSVVGAALLLSISPRDKKANLCPTVLAPEITPMQGIVVEFMMSLFIVLVVFATIDSKRSDHGGSFPLTIGIAIMACILMGVSILCDMYNCVYNLMIIIFSCLISSSYKKGSLPVCIFSFSRFGIRLLSINM